MLNKRNKQGFKKAKSLTELSDFNRVHIGCVAMYNNIPIGVGYNTYKTHPMQRVYDKYRDLHISANVCNMHSMHAEISCLTSIKNSNIKWDKIELYIYRKKMTNNKGMARPCPACMQMIKDKGIKHIYYTTDDGYAYECVL